MLILEGNSEIGAHDVWSDLDYLICLRRLFRSRADINLILFSKKDIISFISAQHVLSYHIISMNTMI